MIKINRGGKMESKRDKFKRLAELRVNNALKDIALISNLANKSSYDYTEEEYRKIIKTLRHAVQKVEQAFDSKDGLKFKL